jgi:hypothetical protein
VGQDVGLDGAPLLKHLAADGAGDDNIGRVEYTVDIETARLAEALSTVLALEGLLFGVDITVVPQVVLPSKGLTTNITGKRPLICMSPLVDEQVVGLGELPVAELADEPLLGLA